MFSFFKKDEVKHLTKRKARMLEEAMLTQRSGDLRKYAFQMEAIEKLEKEIESIQSKK